MNTVTTVACYEAMNNSKLRLHFLKIPAMCLILIVGLLM